MEPLGSGPFCGVYKSETGQNGSGIGSEMPFFASLPSESRRAETSRLCFLPPSRNDPARVMRHGEEMVIANWSFFMGHFRKDQFQMVNLQ